MSSVYVARQPIFELNRGLYGYELLYRRDATVDRADGETGAMSAEVIVDALLGIGLRAIAGGSVAFVNFSQAQLISETWALFDPSEVVIELLETVEPNEETLSACRKMVAAGYRLALDDYVHSEANRALLQFATIAKIDVLGRTEEDIGGVARELKPLGIRLLAERVETATMRDACVKMGFEFFQGYLFSKPETLTKSDVAPGQLAIMRLLNLLNDPNTPDQTLDQAFQSDLALSYKLLRIVNAASMGGRGVTSIPHAVRLIGRSALHRWLSVVLVASMGKRGDVTHELALTSITRARMCELLAANARTARPTGSAFLVGLLSLLDVLFEVPMDAILSHIELSDEVTSALLKRGGPLGTPLRLVESYEQADWDGAQQLAEASDVPEDILGNLYIDSLHWAAQHVAV
jgi:EAL and modified HD-GYP domain-containing signal transduction protein